MIGITDADVSYAAALLDCEFDPAQVAFLKERSSCDVHAGPGSGKTTLLVAKLAILARSWPHRDRGLLVLSHTNVARNEIERRLSRDSAGSRLLGYPHFIGTIQGFVDRFLGLPYLRDVRGRSRTADFVIDNDVFARVAWRKLCLRGATDLSTARNWLRRRFEHDQGKQAVSALSYAGADCTLVTEGGKLAGPESASYLQLKVLKDDVSSEGIFRFADLFAFGAAAVRARPYLVPALRHRFPWVFVDEMQDTEALQRELLSTLFQAPCVVQKLGDRNQAIFRETREDDEPSFASTGALDLPRSFRLAPRIAAFASKLTGVKPQQLTGNSKRKDRAHTVFVFNDETISNVLPSYARLLTTAWPDGFPVDFVAKAVGAKKGTTTSPKRPARISDYWGAFQPDFHAERFPRHSLAAIVHFARSLVTMDRSYHRAHGALMGGVAELLACHEGIRPTRRQLDERMSSGKFDADAVKKLLAALLLRQPPTKEVWPKVIAYCAKLLRVAEAALAVPTRAYLAWEAPATALPQANRGTANVAAFDIDGRAVTIDVSTIHGVKGETHHATLVLETLSSSHDVRGMLPYLVGSASGAPKKQALGHMKRVFVGMTRPRELVCLAVHRAGADDGVLEELRHAGWSVCSV